jgi:hypothetical protein
MAARTHPSKRPLLTLIVVPASVAFILKSAVPDDLVVDVDCPPQLVTAPDALVISTVLSHIFLVWPRGYMRCSVGVRSPKTPYAGTRVSSATDWSWKTVFL